MKATVDHQVDAQEIAMTEDVVAAQELGRRADNPFLGSPWLGRQVLGALTASVIAARLLHVRRARLAAFNLDKSADVVTLAQLAALQRSHKGTFGQGFEVAVCDAVNDQVPGVVTPIQGALQLLGIQAPVAGCIHVALENLAPDVRSSVLEVVQETLPSTATLRTGLRGRPPGAQRVLEVLAEASWAVPPHREDGTGTDLHRADALIWTESHIIAASLKSNRLDVPNDGWKHVPLWITVGFRRPYKAKDRPYLLTGGFPGVVAPLGSRWLDDLRSAHEAVDAALASVDLGRTLGHPAGGEAGLQMRDWLVKRRDDSLTDIIAELRSLLVPEAVALVGQPETVQVEVPLVDNPAVLQGYDLSIRDSGLHLASRHLLCATRIPSL